MILNNTQANIFKVNGGIADNFANRPAASGSFYIFYSIDTQEIFYDNGAWVLLGSGGGGGGVNIYNSDGTLTSQRSLYGANAYILEFLQLPEFNISGPGSNFNTYYLRFSPQNDVIYTEIVGNGIDGIFIDFLQKVYYLGNFNQGNGTYLDITNNFLTGQNYIKTRLQGNDIGLKLDFANNIYQFGKFNDNYLKIDVTNGLIDLGFDGSQILFRVDNINNNVKIGDFNAFNYQTFLLIDDANQLIKTSNQGNDIGLLLDFANSVYQFGQITGGNQSIIKIDDTNQIVNIQKSAIDGGIEVGLLNNYVRLGDWFLLYGGHYIDIIPTRINMTAGGTNTPALAIDSAVDFIRSFYQSNNIGINLDFANSLYQFGQINGGFLNQLVIDDANQIMGFKNGGFYQGFKYDVASLKPYQFGQITSGNLTSIYVNDNAEKISASINNADNGLILDFQNGIEIFGDVNDCYIQLEQGNSYQFQINGTNVLSGTSGGNSGQHLKIKVNGVDYKIELKNP